MSEETVVPPLATSNKTKFRVYKSNIKDEEGNKVLHGEVVELGPKLAKRYNKLGFLRPYIEDDEVDDEPQLETKSRRFSPRRQQDTKNTEKPY